MRKATGSYRTYLSLVKLQPWFLRLQLKTCPWAEHSDDDDEQNIQSGREISAIIVTDDYLCYKEPKSPYNFFLVLIFNELFIFETSDE